MSPSARAKARPSPVSQGWGRRLGGLARDTVEALVLAVVLYVILQVFVQNTVVEGSSMQPNFVDSEHLLVSKLAYMKGAPHRGDVVVFRVPGLGGEDFIKRVVALPGETVELRDGVVFVDGAPLEEPWAPSADTSDFGLYRVPPGHVFVLGDNRADSNDSRVFGRAASGLPGLDEPAISLDLVVGKAWLTVWPLQSVGLVRADAPGPGRSGP